MATVTPTKHHVLVTITVLVCQTSPFVSGVAIIVFATAIDARPIQFLFIITRPSNMFVWTRGACAFSLPSDLHLPIYLRRLIFMFPIDVLAKDLPRSPVVLKSRQVWFGLLSLLDISS